MQSKPQIHSCWLWNSFMKFRKLFFQVFNVYFKDDCMAELELKFSVMEIDDIASYDMKPRGMVFMQFNF